MDVNSFITLQDISPISGTKTLRILPCLRWFINEVYPVLEHTGTTGLLRAFGAIQRQRAGQAGFYVFGPTPDL